MRLVDRHIINRTHNFLRVCDELAFKSKNLYNLANYYCRQHFFTFLKKSGFNRAIPRHQR
ncbi:hypothetical protein [Okeania sp. KiyG1]|uniref:hypothetical protein n=1 Tax=Okeania sp. KiyG1 TaxID=2720165 RepID=UPI001924810A|nr:hypothetical protein [Okeania sp. KiyG1]